MNRTAKKITSLFFLLLGFIPVLLVLSFEINQEAIRERMKQQLEHHPLQKITIAAKAVIWVNNHEIWVNDHLFDIHDFRVENGIYTFSGLFDDEETDLMRQKEHNDQTSNEENNLLEDLLNWLYAPYHSRSEERLFVPIQPVHFALYNPLSVVSATRKVPTPPPQVMRYLPV